MWLDYEQLIRLTLVDIAHCAKQQRMANSKQREGWHQLLDTSKQLLGIVVGAWRAYLTTYFFLPTTYIPLGKPKSAFSFSTLARISRPSMA